MNEASESFLLQQQASAVEEPWHSGERFRLLKHYGSTLDMLAGIFTEASCGEKETC
jgi:hypothetical protein